MRFKDYLKEEELRKPTTTEVSNEELNSWLKKNSPHYLNALLGGHEVKIFRGMKGAQSEFALGDSSTFRRVAANTSNEVQTFLASSEKWKKLPSRERAFICTSSFMSAHGYGKAETYLVIPADNAKIGICPDMDFWSCFNDGIRGTDLYDMADINEVIKYVRERTELKLPEDDAQGLRHDLRQINGDMLIELAKGSKHHRADEVRSVGRFINSHKMENLEQYMEHALDPETNDFTWTHVEDYGGGYIGARELWIEGKAAFIKIGDEGNADKALDKLKKDLYDFEI